MTRIVLASLFLAISLHAAEGNLSPVAKTLISELTSTEREVVSLAEAMPADKYNFAPKQGKFDGVRTFALQATHIAAVNFLVAAAIKGEPNPVDPGKSENGPADLKSKEQIVAFLKQSYAYTREAISTLTQENLMSEAQSPFGKTKSPRLALVTIPQSHSLDHYGQMVVYARMCGVVPPASR